MCGCIPGDGSIYFTGCGKSEESSVSKAESSAASEIALDENAEAAEKLLTDLSGTYHELWPVILADDYRQTWWMTAQSWSARKNAEGAFEVTSSVGRNDIRYKFGYGLYNGGTKGLMCRNTFLHKITSTKKISR